MAPPTKLHVNKHKVRWNYGTRLSFTNYSIFCQNHIPYVYRKALYWSTLQFYPTRVRSLPICSVPGECYYNTIILIISFLFISFLQLCASYFIYMYLAYNSLICYYYKLQNCITSFLPQLRLHCSTTWETQDIRSTLTVYDLPFFGRYPIAVLTATSSSPLRRLHIQSITLMFSPNPGHMNLPCSLVRNQFTW